MLVHVGCITRNLLLICVLVIWAVVDTVNVRNFYKFTKPLHTGHDMVIFVLDRTIWPFQVDSLNQSIANLSVIHTTDLGNLNIYPEVHYCLDTLQKMGFVLAAVCNCKVPSLAEKLLDTFDLTRYFAYQVCSEEDKLSNVEMLHDQSGVYFEDMLYFDYDLSENLPLLEYNVTFCPVDDRGMSMAVVNKALQIFAVRTTLRPPLDTTTKQRNTNDSKEYSLQIDYKNLDFKKPSTAEIMEECESESDDNEY